MKKSFVISLLIVSSLFSQPSRMEGKPVFQFPFHSENIILPAGENSYNLFYTYKIPHRFLVFERTDGEYSAALRVSVEITDSASNLIERGIKDSKLSVDSFEATDDRTLFLQDFLEFGITGGSYIIKTTITDLNSRNEIKLEPAALEINEINTGLVFHPLVIGGAIKCNGEDAFALANSGGAIPFSPEDFHLLIPLTDTTLTDISVVLLSNQDTITAGIVGEFYTMPVGISKCKDDLVVLKVDNSKPTKNFIIRNVNRRLPEGKIRLQIILTDSINREFSSDVIWINKPFSLYDPAMAIELLRFIEPDSVIYRMLASRESDYPEILNSYWASFDPTPESAFNPLMAEYYRRVDYAAKEFRGLGKEDGIKTDRGMIYIRFGKPDSVERASNTQGQVVETWTYKNPERKFVFVDKRGTGNFTLIEN